MPDDPPPPSIVREAGGALWRFARGQTIVAAILVIFHAVGFWAVGTPLWWLSGPLVGALSFVPYFGFLIGAALAAIVTVLGGGGIQELLWLLAVLIAGQLVEAFYLTPRILGRELDLHPLLVFAAVLIGLMFFGPLGAFLAAPAVAIGLIVWRAIKRRAAARRRP